MNDADFVLEVTDSITPEDWEAERRALDATFYHSVPYSRIRQGEGGTPVFFRLRNSGGRRVGIALGILSDQWRHWPLNLVFRCLEFQSQPVTEGNDAQLISLFSRRIVAYARRIGVAGIKLHSEDSPISAGGLESLGLTAVPRLEFVIDIAADDADLLARMKAKRRTRLRKMMREGTYKVVERNDVETMRILMAYQSSSHERRQRRGERYNIGSVDGAQAIWRNYVASGHGRLFLVEVENKPVAGMLLHCFDGKAYYSLGGSSPEGFRAHAPVFMVWDVMRRLRDKGYRLLNLGGVPAKAPNPEHQSHGLYYFKTSFGGREIACTTWQQGPAGWRAPLLKLLG